MVFLTEWKGNGIYKSSIKGNAETREALFERYNNDSSSKFTSVWASYIFVFIAVLITFSIVIAVCFMVNTMTYNGNNKIPTNMFNPRFQLFNEQSFGVIQRARDHLRRVPMGRNFTEININLKNRFASTGLFRKVEASNKWKKAERRVTVISFPKINIQKKEQQKKKLANQEALNKLPIIEAEFQDESDYFGYYLKAENIECDEEPTELEKFSLFCEKDESQEEVITTYFAEKGREFLKERQFEILKESDVLKKKENEVFNQKNAKYFEKNYYFMVEDFARLSFELCSLNSSLQIINSEKHEIKAEANDVNIKMLEKEIYKEELWINKIEKEISKVT
uniref:Uncharacterized protein n=1 Tax=Panagrolaimus sp. PS1159 TaxID=55785 RepID=A0AC35GKC6_9BILA